MDTDVLIVGAGPTGLMLANQLARRGIRFEIIDRHSGPAQQSRAMAVQARTLEIYSKMGIVEQALALGARGTGANMWASGRLTARIPVGDIGKGLSPFPFILMLGQDDNERIMGDKLRELGVDVQWNTELIALEQQADHVDVTLKQPDGTHAEDQRRVGCRLRRLAQRRARDERHRVSGRALRARVLRRRYRGDRLDGAGRAQRLSVAGRISPVLPDARQGSLARHRHPAAGACASRGDVTFDEVVPSLRQEAGSRSVVQVVQLVLDLSHPSPRRASASATGAASCSATRRTSTARWARRE